MSMKKLSMLLAAGFLSLPVIASAELETYNYTNEDSSVRITSGSLHPCSSTVPKFGVYTPHKNADGSPGYSHVPPDGVRVICLTSAGGQCSADIYMSRECTGPVVAHAVLNLRSVTVSSLTIMDPKYRINANGSRIELHYS